MEITISDIEKAIIRSQHCQRNWDLDKPVPEEDLALMLHSVTQCPSKQNTAFYNVYCIQDRNIIEKIHENTSGFYSEKEGKTVTNSQTLANVLFVFTSNVEKSTRIPLKQEKFGDADNTVVKDLHMSVGVAAGFLNVTSSLLGYNTGCCACFWGEKIQEILNTDETVLLMMGVGWKSDKNRRIHHNDDTFVFPAIPKEEIKVTLL